MEVTFGPLPEWQKRDCINQSASHECLNEAVQEAVVGSGNVRAGIRCCSDTACMARAAEMSQAAYAGMTGAR